jgi:RNA polymerase sigma-70 factor (ECF subfamily)
MMSSADHEDDADLVRAVQRRNGTAFDILYRRHATAVYAVVVRELRDAAQADDLTQLAFTRLWERASTIHPEVVRLRAWLVRVAHNAAIDTARRARPTATLDEVAMIPSPDRADEPAMYAERSSAVRAALDRLPDDQRRAVELAYFGGLTQTEIADVLEEPLGTVKGRIRLAMRKLRESLEPFQEEYA